MALISDTVTYHDLGTSLTGLLVRDDSAAGRRPGILLIHGGAGLDEHAREQARRWAGLDYVVFACDMYGDDAAGNRERIMSRVRALADDPALLVQRARAGLDVLRQDRDSDGRLAAVGYCFGGMAALSLARAGEPIAAAVSIHGSLKTPAPASPGSVQASLLICHGAADPHVPPADVTAFAAEMEHVGADWQLMMYGGALHGFTHRNAQPGATPGVAFDARADRRSFEQASRFLTEVFSLSDQEAA